MKQINKSKRNEVRKGILESFASSEYPGDGLLVELDPEEDPDSGEIFEMLQGKSWQELLSQLEEIDGPELYSFCWVYSMLTPQAFCYYLPAFLIVSLDLDRADVVGTNLFDTLQSPDMFENEDDGRYAKEVANQLTSSQRTATQNWVRYLLDEYSEYPQTSLLRHWL